MMFSYDSITGLAVVPTDQVQAACTTWLRKRGERIASDREQTKQNVLGRRFIVWKPFPHIERVTLENAEAYMKRTEGGSPWSTLWSEPEERGSFFADEVMELLNSCRHAETMLVNTAKWRTLASYAPYSETAA